jgi:hypothetical protein
VKLRLKPSSEERERRFEAQLTGNKALAPTTSGGVLRVE